MIIASVHSRGIVKRDVYGKSCPVNSHGDYPSCVCESGSQYNEIHNICPAKSLESLAGSCPDDSSGEYNDEMCCFKASGPLFSALQWSLCFKITRIESLSPVSIRLHFHLVFINSQVYFPIAYVG